MSETTPDNGNPADSEPADNGFPASGSGGVKSAVDLLKRAVVATWAFLRRQKVPPFLLFYREHWHDLLTFIRDGFSAPADSELWIRSSDPSPGVYREGSAWDIDASSHCVICGAVRATERERVRAVVYDFDGLIYGVLAALLAAVVLRFGTGSWLIAIGVFVFGLWGARRLVVEEQVRIHCSTCPKHAGSAESLHMRLKRETLIVDLGSRKARLNFLRKSREAPGENAWAPPSPTDDRDAAVPPVTSVPLAGADGLDDQDDEAVASAYSPPPPPDPAEEPKRIPLVDSDDDTPVPEFQTFELHAADGQSVDEPLASKHEPDSERVSHYFRPDSESVEPPVIDIPAQSADSVTVPASDSDAETIPFAAQPPHVMKSDSNWFCRIDGVEIGPVPLEQAQKLKSSGTLKSTDAVRQESDSGWSSPEVLPPAATPESTDTKPGALQETDPWTQQPDDSDSLWDPWSE